MRNSQCRDCLVWNTAANVTTAIGIIVRSSRQRLGLIPFFDLTAKIGTICPTDPDAHISFKNPDNPDLLGHMITLVQGSEWGPGSL